MSCYFVLYLNDNESSTTSKDTLEENNRYPTMNIAVHNQKRKGEMTVLYLATA